LICYKVTTILFNNGANLSVNLGVRFSQVVEVIGNLVLASGLVNNLITPERRKRTRFLLYIILGQYPLLVEFSSVLTSFFYILVNLLHFILSENILSHYHTITANNLFYLTHLFIFIHKFLPDVAVATLYSLKDCLIF